MKHTAIFLIFAFTTVCASAFDAGSQKSRIEFKAEQCQLLPGEATTVTFWTQRYRDSLGIISLSIELKARASDPASIDLGLCRIKTLTELLRPIVNARGMVPIEFHIKARAPNEPDLSSKDVAVMEIEPACTRTGQCGPLPSGEDTSSK